MKTTIPENELYGYPLSFAQRRLWFMDQLFPGTPLYNLPLVLHLTRPVDVPVLERALREMARRHESLRTTFQTVRGDPVQVIHDDAPVRVTVVPLDHLAPTDREAAAMAFAAADLQRPFDLAEGPLWRATLVRLDAADHLLLITAHHIISDGWSMGLMLRELQALYGASAAGAPSPLPELALQYVDYAIWQHEHLTSELVERQLAYWRETLHGLPTIELPTDRPRPPTASLKGRRHHFDIPARLRRALDDLGHGEGATPFMTLLSTYALLLQRYTGESDIPIGTPIAGRARAEFESLIGLFVNTLVLRVDLQGDPTFRALLRRVRERALEAYACQDLPFEKLVEELQPTRDLSRNPLFQVMFALQNAPTAGPEASAAVLRSVEVETGSTNFDLALDVWRRGDGYAARIEYNLDLFDADTIERLSAHWLALLEAVADDPDRRLSSYCLAGGGEDVLNAFPADLTTCDAGDEATTVVDAIRARAALNPDAPAVVSGVEILTYGALHARAAALAVRLRAGGVRRDRPVAVLMERSPSLVIGLLATWYAGGAYVPIDLRDADMRLRQILADIRPSAILTTHAHESRCTTLASSVARALDPPLVFLDDPQGTSALDAEERLAAPEDLAYIVYTSGSTGQPRGVAVEHCALANHLRWMQAAFPLAPGDRTIQTTSLGFDVSLWELAAPLAAGAAMVLPPDDDHGQPQRIVALLAEQGVCMLQTTPSFLRLMLEERAFAACSAIRHVFCGAESMPIDLAHRFARSGLQATLHNMYGPTEAAIDAASYECPSRADITETRSGTVPIGKPIPNVRLHVLDIAGRPVPPGLPGELHVTGANLARGYWRRPELTADRFRPSPFGPPGTRMYRTGDRVRMLRSGDIELLGRIDRQVKVRGVRIEPAEVERALTLHPDVRDAWVTADRHPTGDTRLAAYVAAGIATLTSGELRQFLTSHLPPPMIPTTLVVLAELPRTSRGKVDTASLARLAASLDQGEERLVLPRSEIEAAVLDIWRSVLDVTRVGVNDNFFDLGGHSLLATQVVSRVAARFGVAIPLRAFFEQPTIEGLAAGIAQRSTPDAGTHLQPIGPDSARPAAEALGRLSDHEVHQLLRTLLERDAAR